MKLNIKSINDKTKLTTKGLSTMAYDDDDDDDDGYNYGASQVRVTDGAAVYTCSDV